MLLRMASSISGYGTGSWAPQPHTFEERKYELATEAITDVIAWVPKSSPLSKRWTSIVADVMSPNAPGWRDRDVLFRDRYVQQLHVAARDGEDAAVRCGKAMPPVPIDFERERERAGRLEQSAANPSSGMPERISSVDLRQPQQVHR